MNNNENTTLEKHNYKISQEQAIKYAKHLGDLLCKNVTLLEISTVYSYTDYALLATTLSDVHRRGIVEDMPEYFIQEDLEAYTEYCLNRNQANKMGDWVLVDLKDMIVHLMTEDMRDFYELEKLWFEAKILYHSE